MPRPVSPSRLAALHALSTGSSYDAAGTLHGVSRQAVAQAIRRLASTPRKRGRRPSAVPRRPVTVGEHHVRLTEAEIAAYTAAAGDAPMATWLRDQAERFARQRRETISAWIRRAGDEGIRRASR